MFRISRRTVVVASIGGLLVGLGGCFAPESERALNVKDEIVDRYGNEPWFEAAGIGTRDSEWVVIVTVNDTDQVPGDFPRELAGVQIVIDAGEIVSLDGSGK